jgi:sigma-B regulation protein RsbU (phosphoserine phosphatase)
LLGVIEEPHLEDVDVRLAPGEVLVLYTDGVFRRNDAEGAEAATLTRTLAGTPLRSAAEARVRLEASIRDLVGEGQEDDIAVLLLRAR